MPIGVYIHRKHTVEQRKRISESVRRAYSEKRHKICLNISPEINKKRSESLIQAYREGRHIISKGGFMLGKKHTKDTRKKMSIAKKWKSPSNKGIPMKEEQKEKIRIARAKQVIPKYTEERRRSVLGEGNPFWRGGVTIKHPTRPKPDTCEICGIHYSKFKRGLCYDHDHITGKFRGWICMKCNCALGFADDSTKRLTDLINYLEKHAKN